MAVTDDPTTHGRARLPFSSVADIEEFVATLERYERGEMSPDQWRAFRLVRGTYGQRQTTDSQMLRIKIPQGVVTADQLRAMADVGERYSRKFGHITTRQNIQFHFVKLHDVEPAMRRLDEAGLTTREACGNAVRNITGCVYAGVSADEVFDVTPYGEAMTRYLLRHPLAARLPRKFKIAFEGCREDHIATAINDLGFRALVDAQGTRGFRVVTGGGTALMCRSAGLLHEFLPAKDMYRVAEAVLKVFQRLGDYEHRQRNRLKFLINTMGWDRFIAEYQREFAAAQASAPDATVESPEAESAPSWTRRAAPAPSEIRARVSATLPIGPGIMPSIAPMHQPTDEAYQRWRKSNVQPQKQFGFVTVLATVPLGDLTGEQMRVLGDLADAYADGTIRLTMDQNVLFRWVKISDVHELYTRLLAASLGLGEASTVADVGSCPGAESCKLAVTQSRGLGQLLEEHLRARPDLVDAADGARIKISGCPNGCGQHHIATIGFQGSVRRLEGKAVPQYFVMVGGGVTDAGAQFARLAAKVPARRVPEVVERLIALYQRERQPGESAPSFFGRLEVSRVTELVADLQRLDAKDAVPTDFIDLAETAAFAPEVMEGECSA